MMRRRDRRRQFVTWRAENAGPTDLPDGALAACMITYAQLHGAIVAEGRAFRYRIGPDPGAELL